jgi:hypothetical protein
VNYSLKVVELVWLLLVINYVVDFMNVCDIVQCMIYLVYSACFGGSAFGEAVKICSSKGPRVSRWLPPSPNIFVG